MRHGSRTCAMPRCAPRLVVSRAAMHALYNAARRSGRRQSRRQVEERPEWCLLPHDVSRNDGCACLLLSWNDGCACLLLVTSGGDAPLKSAVRLVHKSAGSVLTFPWSRWKPWTKPRGHTTRTRPSRGGRRGVSRELSDPPREKYTVRFRPRSRRCKRSTPRTRMCWCWISACIRSMGCSASR
jgi:hypothetical protein